MILKDFKNQIASAIEAELGAELKDYNFELGYSSEPQFGDFYCNAAMVYARPLKQSPRDIAEQLAQVIKRAVADVDKVEVAGPGFLNLWMKPSYWQHELATITPEYARSSQGGGQKVQVEFISANPTGPLTLANARGGFLGDVIGNVLAWSGAAVTKEYYVNDGGGQVGKLVDSLKAEVGLPIEGERQYRGQYLADLAAKIDPRQASSDEEVAKAAVAALLREIKRAAERLGVTFDEWFSEQSLVSGGATKEMLEWLRTHHLVYEKEGATWLSSTDYDDERDRVLVRSNGEPTYLLNDLAYHYNIFEKRHFTRSVKLWGADHAGQVPSLKLTTKRFAPSAQLDFVLIQFVRLIQDGKEVKMSKRAGTYVTIDELMDTLESALGDTSAAAVARWFFLMRSADSHMDFDLDLAREQSAKNPYYYVMYAYARANSMLAKAKEHDLKPAKRSLGLNDAEHALVRGMSRLPELVSQMAEDYGVHRLTFYGQEMAKLFTDFYESERIIGLEPQAAAHKLYVVQQFIVFMDVYWRLLGIEPQRRMDREIQT